MKTTIYIGMLQRNWQNEPDIHITPCDMSEYYENSSDVIFYSLLDEREIEVPDIPSQRDITRMKIDGLERYSEKIKAEARAKVRQIDEQIANLRSLEHMTEGEDDA